MDAFCHLTPDEFLALTVDEWCLIDVDLTTFSTYVIPAWTVQQPLFGFVVILPFTGTVDEVDDGLGNELPYIQLPDNHVAVRVDISATTDTTIKIYA